MDRPVIPIFRPQNNIVLRGEGEIAKQGKISGGVPRLLAGIVDAPTACSTVERNMMKFVAS